MVAQLSNLEIYACFSSPQKVSIDQSLIPDFNLPLDVAMDHTPSQSKQIKRYRGLFCRTSSETLRVKAFQKCIRICARYIHQPTTCIASTFLEKNPLIT